MNDLLNKTQKSNTQDFFALFSSQSATKVTKKEQFPDIGHSRGMCFSEGLLGSPKCLEILVFFSKYLTMGWNSIKCSNRKNAGILLCVICKMKRVCYWYGCLKQCWSVKLSLVMNITWLLSGGKENSRKWSALWIKRMQVVQKAGIASASRTEFSSPLRKTFGYQAACSFLINWYFIWSSVTVAEYWGGSLWKRKRLS